jgi:hypothetical protein
MFMFTNIGNLDATVYSTWDLVNEMCIYIHQYLYKDLYTNKNTIQYSYSYINTNILIYTFVFIYRLDATVYSTPDLMKEMYIYIYLDI